MEAVANAADPAIYELFLVRTTYCRNAALAAAFCVGISFYISIFLPIIVFQTLNQFVERHSDGAQDDDGSDHHVQLKDLGTVDDQIAKSASGGEKFPYDDTHQRQSDIHLHVA